MKKLITLILLPVFISAKAQKVKHNLNSLTKVKTNFSPEDCKIATTKGNQNQNSYSKRE